MRGAATGVSIVATDGPAGRYGLTVSAFSSVSAEPPMVLVCINRRSPACAAVRRNRRFCVNVLSQAQRSMANTFAGRPEAGDAYEFHAASWTSSATGAPRLDGCTASFDCVLQTSIDAGTHSIFIGAVKALESTGTSPLVYVDGAYSHTCSKS
jgi:flavin reductase